MDCSVCLQASGKNLNLNDESQHGLLMQLLKLAHNCLNFDFIGTSTDESSDDLCTVQIPTSWRSGNLAFSHFHATVFQCLFKEAAFNIILTLILNGIFLTFLRIAYIVRTSCKKKKVLYFVSFFCFVIMTVRLIFIIG